MSLLRTRWAAVGAAVAVTLGGGGLVFVDAAQDSGERSVYNPIEPCRLVDTRPDKGIGSRTTPLGEGEILTVPTHGTSGECTGTPTDITAVQLNITPVLPTEPTDLTIWPTGDAPNASALNPAPGQPPTPNAVTSQVTNTGEFRIRNKFGNVHLIVDLVGYYRDHTHDDRYYTESEMDLLADGIAAANSFISLDPAAFDVDGSAYYDENVGLVLPDTAARFSFGFTIPPDLEPDGGFDFRLVWLTDDVTNCTHNLFDLDFIYKFHYGVPPVGVFTYRVIPFAPPTGPYDVQWLGFRSDDQNSIKPHDTILVTIDRQFESGCTTGDVRIVGASASYDGGYYPED